MNKIIGKRSWLGSLDIGAIKLDAKSRETCFLEQNSSKFRLNCLLQEVRTK